MSSGEHHLNEAEQLRRDRVVGSIMQWFEALQAVRDIGPTLVEVGAPHVFWIYLYTSVLVKIDRLAAKLKKMHPPAEVAMALKTYRRASVRQSLLVLRNAVEHEDEYLSGLEDEGRRRDIEDDHNAHLAREGNKVLYPDSEVYAQAKDAIVVGFNSVTRELSLFAWRGRTYDPSELAAPATQLAKAIDTWVEQDTEMASVKRETVTRHRIHDLLREG